MLNEKISILFPKNRIRKMFVSNHDGGDLTSLLRQAGSKLDFGTAQLLMCGDKLFPFLLNQCPISIFSFGSKKKYITAPILEPAMVRYFFLLLAQMFFKI
jgi:hypothetical protein